MPQDDLPARTPAFARDPTTAAYCEQRVPEYDDWYLGQGLFADRDRPGWSEDVARVVDLVATLPPARTLDVDCGSGFLTRRLSADGLAEEIGGRPPVSGRWFVGRSPEAEPARRPLGWRPPPSLAARRTARCDR